MKVGSQPQSQRTAATRTALIAAARALFGARGYAQVATEEIVQAAGVTRGALYHHFDGKAALFAAVYESVEGDLIVRLRRAMAGPDDPDRPADPDAMIAMRRGAAAWLDACDEADIRRITLLDAPAVLGWTRWRSLGDQYGLGLVRDALSRAMAAGRIRVQPIAPLAHVLLGALRESALYLADAAESADAVEARREVGDVIDGLLTGLA